MRWLVWLGIRMRMENGTRVGKQMADQTVEGSYYHKSYLADRHHEGLNETQTAWSSGW